MKIEVELGDYAYDLNISASGNFAYYTADIGEHQLIFRAKRYVGVAFRASFGKLCVEGVADASLTFKDVFENCLRMMGFDCQE